MMVIETKQRADETVNCAHGGKRNGPPLSSLFHGKCWSGRRPACFIGTGPTWRPWSTRMGGARACCARLMCSAGSTPTALRRSSVRPLLVHIKYKAACSMATKR